MTSTLMPERTAGPRESRPLHFLMSRPDHFEVTYAINPWMDPSATVDRERAVAQWDSLRSAYEAHGHRVDVVPAVPGLPDMVFSANAGVAFGSTVVVARFTFAERQGESVAYGKWFRDRGYETVIEASSENEGEGDFLSVGRLMLAGTGFRTTLAAHHEVREAIDMPVISLQLVDPRFYHLDTALFVLDDMTVAYYPPAFSPESRAVLEQLFPDAIIATDADAAVLGLNAVSDGLNVFITAAATDMHAALRERGFNPVGIELSELLKAGGSVKCCTLELHP
jgi:N-dimethylarginine dimethylaminohydrolase